MSEENKREMNIADGLRRVKAIEQKFPVIAREINKYCSKKKGQPDVIPNQKKHVQSLIQQYKDLMKEWTAIKLAIQTANLETEISFTKDDMTIRMSLAEAILWKGVRGARAGRKEFELMLWNSFSTAVADREITNARQLLLTNRDIPPEEMAQAINNLVPELLGWSEVDVQKQKEFVMDFGLELDAIIDRANITTLLKL